MKERALKCPIFRYFPFLCLIYRYSIYKNENCHSQTSTVNYFERRRKSDDQENFNKFLIPLIIAFTNRRRLQCKLTLLSYYTLIQKIVTLWDDRRIEPFICLEIYIICDKPFQKQHEVDMVSGGDRSSVNSNSAPFGKLINTGT